MAQIEDVSSSLATTLFDITKNLQRYIDEQADEIAAPRIAEAERSCRSSISGLERAQAIQRQRWDDLEKELRRQLAAQERNCERYRRMLTEAGINPLTGTRLT